MLKFRQSVVPSLPEEVVPQSFLHRKCSFSTSQLGHSKATIILRNLSLPLAWPVDEYFGEKKEWREFTVQLVLKSNRNSVSLFSKPKGVNQTFTDIEFSGDFVFPDEDSNFCIELNVLCKRINENSGAVASSLGRSIGLSWRRYQQREETKHNLTSATRFSSVKNCNTGAPNRGFLEDLRKFGIREELRGALGEEKPSSPLANSVSKPFSKEGQIIGYVRFRLANATLSGRTHSYVLEALPNHLLPIYGNISAQILVQPNSLVTPLAQGSLDIFIPNGGILHQHMYCILQGGQLHCWETKVDEELDLKHILCKTPTICLQIIGKERLERTAFPTAFRLTMFNNDSFLCICPSKHALIGWRNAIYLQQHDNIVWAEFAQIQKNPYALVLGESSSTINLAKAELSQVHKTLTDIGSSHEVATSRPATIRAVPSKKILFSTQHRDNDNMGRKISRSVSHTSPPARISILQVFRQEHQDQERRTEICNVNVCISEEINKHEKLKRRQISHNYVLSLPVNGIGMIKNNCSNDMIQTEMIDKAKTVLPNCYSDIHSKPTICKDKQERPFNINLDYNFNMSQQKVPRDKVECFETWQSLKKSSVCTRL